jgi:AraC-like DNA-binding protein
MDPMSDVLAGMQVTSFGYARLEARAPWGVSYAKHSASLGIILDGCCWLTVDEIPDAIPLNAGDCFLIVHGHAHALRAHPSDPVRPFGDILARNQELVSYGGSGVPATIVGGWFRFDRLSSQPLTKILPPLIHIPASAPQSLSLQTTLKLVASETAVASPGSRVVVNRLAEVLFIQMIRAFVSAELNTQAGWLSALSDHQIGAALKLLHTHVAQAWTVGSLADAVGLSRSAFAHRFRQLVGEAPMEYLTSWRMSKACRFLRSGNKTLNQIAQSVGYDSDAAFNHAFRRIVGVTPGQYRAGQKQVQG